MAGKDIEPIGQTAQSTEPSPLTVASPTLEEPYELRRVPGGYVKVYRPGPLSNEEVARLHARSSTRNIADTERRSVAEEKLFTIFLGRRSEPQQAQPQGGQKKQG